MLVINRFQVSAAEADAFRSRLEGVHAILGAQRGYVGGRIGRNVDDAGLWVLQTEWEGAGAYRRALSAYEVKVIAWEVLGQAIEEPSGYEVVEPGQPTNQAVPRG